MISAKPRAATAASALQADKMVDIILASASPRRRELFEKYKIFARIVVSDEDELSPVGLPPADYVMAVAMAKAEAVRRKSAASPKTVVVAADTIVYADGKILGKPSDLAEASRVLRFLSGRTHEVYTGLAILGGNKRVSDFERTEVVFRTLLESEIDAYVNICRPLDKAGAYGIQDYSGLFVSKIDGDYLNVVGMPMCKTAALLRDCFGVELMP